MNNPQRNVEFTEAYSADPEKSGLSENHCVYEIKTDHNECVGTDILLIYFGNLWEFVLRRLAHQIDGFIMSIRFNGCKLMIYRKIETGQPNGPPHLRLLK